MARVILRYFSGSGGPTSSVPSVDVVNEVLTDRPPCGVATVAVSGPGIGRGRLAAVGQTTAKNPTQNDCR